MNSIIVWFEIITNNASVMQLTFTKMIKVVTI